MRYDNKNFHPPAYGALTWRTYVRYDNKNFHPPAYGALTWRTYVRYDNKNFHPPAYGALRGKFMCGMIIENIRCMTVIMSFLKKEIE